MKTKRPLSWLLASVTCVLPTLLAQAQGPPQDAILSVTPNTANPGDTGVTVTFSLVEETPRTPPTDVQPTAARLGNIAGAPVIRTNYTVTAVFNFTGASPGVVAAELDFPSPEGTLTFTKAGAFTIGQGSEGEGEGGVEGEGEGEGDGEGEPLSPGILTYPVVDTGQNTCYNASSSISCPGFGQAFHGQDAQYDGYQTNYTVSGDGLTVDDNITGLTWQQSPDVDGDGDIDAADKLTWTELQAYPATLNAAHFGGYSDWRLPHIKELYSLIDFRGEDPSGYEGSDTSGLVPFIDDTVFDFGYGDTGAGERIIDAQFGSSTLYVDNTANDGGGTLFGVNFADGRIKGYGLSIHGSDKTFYVLCVRGNTAYGENSFLNNGDGTVTDEATGLMWSKTDSAAGLDWEEALAWAEAKNTEVYLGHNDWRLPNVKELRSLLDYSRSPSTSASPAITAVFNTTAITNEAGQTDYPCFWSGTTHAAAAGRSVLQLGWLPLRRQSRRHGRRLHACARRQSDMPAPQQRLCQPGLGR